MSDLPEKEERTILAAEYVAGLLSPEQARELARLAESDPALSAEITQWERDFAPIAEAAGEAEPSPLLWRRIERDVAPAVASPVEPRRSTPWRSIALASMAVAACLAAWVYMGLVFNPPAQPWARAAALLAEPGNPLPALRATVSQSGEITVVPLQALAVPPGHALGFWAWPRGKPAPVLLGMLPPQGGRLAFPYPPIDGTPVMVTSEPAAGAGATPGPTLFLGLLVAAS